MPNKASAKKRVRQNAKRRLHNRAGRAKMRTVLKNAREAVESNTPEVAEVLRNAQSVIAKAAGKGLVKPRNASRKISRLAKAANKAKAAAKA